MINKTQGLFYVLQSCISEEQHVYCLGNYLQDLKYIYLFIKNQQGVIWNKHMLYYLEYF